MSLKAKDISLITLIVVSALSALYLQYFSGAVLRGYAPYVWGSLVLTLLLFLRFAEMGVDFLAYIKAAKGELKKVVWPGKDEVLPALIAVGVAVVVFSLLISLMDTVIVKMLSTIIG